MIIAVRIQTSKNRSAVLSMPMANPRIRETDIATENAIAIRRNVTRT